MAKGAQVQRQPEGAVFCFYVIIAIIYYRYLIIKYRVLL